MNAHLFVRRVPTEPADQFHLVCLALGNTTFALQFLHAAFTDPGGVEWIKEVCAKINPAQRKGDSLRRLMQLEEALYEKSLRRIFDSDLWPKETLVLESEYSQEKHKQLAFLLVAGSIIKEVLQVLFCSQFVPVFLM